jgi:1,4-alpha-glucan branching enzyme
VLRVPRAGFWRELVNSDAPFYGGSGAGNLGGTDSRPGPGGETIEITLPPLGALFLRAETR